MKKKKYNMGGMTGAPAGLGALGQPPQPPQPILPAQANQNAPAYGAQAGSLYPGPVGTFPTANTGRPFKKGGSVKSSASSRGDGIAQRGKTRG